VLPDDLPPAFKTEAFKAAWTEWVGHRKDIRHPLTSRAAKMCLGQLTEWGVEKAIVSIQTSVASGWRGLFEPKETKHGSDQQRESDVDRRRREQRAKEFPEPERPLPRL
jgi:hypothetical protein